MEMNIWGKHEAQVRVWYSGNIDSFNLNKILCILRRSVLRHRDERERECERRNTFGDEFYLCVEYQQFWCYSVLLLEYKLNLLFPLFIFIYFAPSDICH